MYIHLSPTIKYALSKDILAHFLLHLHLQGLFLLLHLHL